MDLEYITDKKQEKCLARNKSKPTERECSQNSLELQRCMLPFPARSQC
jgi:hypothetical protein